MCLVPKLRKLGTDRLFSFKIIIRRGTKNGEASGV
jgi:hypothetical protein